MPPTRVAYRRTVLIAAALTAARARSPSPVFVGYLELYCDGEECSMREVVVHVKEYDAALTPRLRCPACGNPLKLHHVQTLEERVDADEANARRSVNAQRYRQRHPDEAVPIGALLDDSLSGGSAS